MVTGKLPELVRLYAEEGIAIQREVLGGFLRAAGVPDERIPAGAGERSTLFRTWMAGRPALVVLDDACGAEQVQPLLPGSAECAVIVTSRYGLHGVAGARVLALDVPDEAECLELLASRTVGRLAYVARAGTPDIVPVNYRYVDGRVVIRSAPGPKLQAAERRERVALEVDELDEETRSGWSVVVHGRATVLRPEHEPPEGAVPWAPGPRRHVLQVVPERVTGRRLDPSC